MGLAGGTILESLSKGDWARIGRRLRVSPQQLRIIQLILVEGLKIDAIALRLGVKRSTITTQLDRLWSKLGHASRARLAVQVCSEVVAMRGDRD